MRTLLVCDRSAGHIFPALVFGKKLKNKQKSNEIYFFATSYFLKKYLKDEGFTVFGKSFSSRSLILEMVWRLLEAVYLLFRVKPNRIIGFGGRDSFFLVVLGSVIFLDTAIYEPNVNFGKANKLLSFFVKKVWYGFNDNRNKNRIGKKMQCIGIPLRENLKVIDKTEALKILGFNHQPVIFCFGGSQGSAFINNIFIKFIRDIKEDCQVVHITGKRESFQILQLYNKIRNKRFVKDFYYSMEVLYSAADIVISRAGASTLGEIAYYKIPAILIPHPCAGNHQRDNAIYFKNRGAAFVFSQNNFSFEEFKRTVENLLYDNDLRQKIKDNLAGINVGVGFSEFGSNVDWL